MSKLFLNLLFPLVPDLGEQELRETGVEQAAELDFMTLWGITEGSPTPELT